MDYVTVLNLNADGKECQVQKHHLRGCNAHLYSIDGKGLCNGKTVRDMAKQQYGIRSHALENFTNERRGYYENFTGSHATENLVEYL